MACCQAVRTAGASAQQSLQSGSQRIGVLHGWAHWPVGRGWLPRRHRARLPWPMQRLVPEQGGQGIALGLLLGLPRAAVGPALSWIAVAAFGQPDALGSRHRLATRSDRVGCCRAEGDGFALAHQPRELGPVRGHLVGGAGPLGLRGIGAARNRAQAVGEGHNQGCGRDAADRDRADAMAHEPQPHGSGIENEGAERNGAEHHGTDDAVNLGVGALVAVAGRQRDADRSQAGRPGTRTGLASQPSLPRAYASTARSISSTMAMPSLRASALTRSWNSGRTFRLICTALGAAVARAGAGRQRPAAASHVRAARRGRRRQSACRTSPGSACPRLRDRDRHQATSSAIRSSRRPRAHRSLCAPPRLFSTSGPDLPTVMAAM